MRLSATMLLGLKLDIGFSEDQVCHRLYGEREILAYLRELGVEAVETPVGPETQPDALREHIRRCVSAGMKVSLHPYSEATIFNLAYFSPEEDNPCRELHPRFFSLAAEAARLQQYPTVVNLHGAAGTPTDTREHLLDRSVAFFTWAREWCRRNAPQVHVTVELQISPNTDEARLRIGDTYEEVLAIVKQSRVGACWDFGHAYWNARRYGWPIEPPEDLLRRIVHIHCHDVHGGDHEPLVYNVVPWRQFIHLLGTAGFDGRVILEVGPSSFLRAGGIQTLIDSIQALRDCIQQCRTELNT
jgi:sugar phosphate isomerase/epimerase